MTTPAEKDAMALAVLDKAHGMFDNIRFERRHDKPDRSEYWTERIREVIEARAHLAARVAEDADEIFRLNARLIEETNRADRAEAELAAVREWLAKLESFVGPGALAYMRREFDAARGAW